MTWVEIGGWREEGGGRRVEGGGWGEEDGDKVCMCSDSC